MWGFAYLAQQRSTLCGDQIVGVSGQSFCEVSWYR